MKKLALLFVLITSIVRVEGIASVTVLKNPRTQKSVLLLGDLHEEDGEGYEQLREFNEQGILNFLKQCFDISDQNCLLSRFTKEQKSVDIIFESEDYSDEQLKEFESTPYATFAITFKKLIEWRNNFLSIGYDCTKMPITLLPYEPRGRECDYLRSFMPPKSVIAPSEWVSGQILEDMRLKLLHENYQACLKWMQKGVVTMEEKTQLTIRGYLEYIKKHPRIIFEKIRSISKKHSGFSSSGVYRFVFLLLHSLNTSITELETLIKQYNSDLDISIYRGILNVLETEKNINLLLKLNQLIIQNCDSFFVETAYFLDVLVSQMERDKTILIAGSSHIKNISLCLQAIGYEVQKDWDIDYKELPDGRTAMWLDFSAAKKNIVEGLQYLYK